MDTTKQAAMEKAKAVYHSGAIDKEIYEDNYILPKMFMTAFASHIKEMWHPLAPTPQEKQELKNIEIFI